ncbi:MAG TPA: phosphate ABC transporter permease subunit PstC [Symbiobacteriaceae bacterium]|nr:phosphate ABC transporter permease subunit PstC [Symbiobacteriaceae bacterium]
MVAIPGTASRHMVEKTEATRRARQVSRERLIARLLLASGWVSILVTAGIVFSLLFETAGFFQLVTLRQFFTDPKWTPAFDPAHYGILSLLAGTTLIAAGSALVAVPLGLASAIYLSEYAPERLRRVLRPIMELLAGIPTVVYGYFALTFVTPLLKRIIPDLDVFNALSAFITVGIMITPLISSMSEDAMLAVPRSLREAAFALGATRLEVALKVVLPAAFSGVMASVILAVSRAVGETMIVALAAGSTPKLTLNPLQSIQTMTGYIAQMSQGDLEAGSPAYKAIYAVGMSLFLITLGLNLFAKSITRRMERGGRL